MPGPKKFMGKIKNPFSGNKGKEEKSQSTWYVKNDETLQGAQEADNELGSQKGQTTKSNTASKTPPTAKDFEVDTEEPKFTPEEENSYNELVINSKKATSEIDSGAQGYTSGKDNTHVVLSKEEEDIANIINRDIAQNPPTSPPSLDGHYIVNRGTTTHWDPIHWEPDPIYDDVPNEKEDLTYGNIDDKRNTVYADIDTDINMGLSPIEVDENGVIHNDLPEHKRLEQKRLEHKRLEQINMEESLKYRQIKTSAYEALKPFKKPGKAIVITTDDNQLFYLNEENGEIGSLDPDNMVFLNKDGTLRFEKNLETSPYSTIDFNQNKNSSGVTQFSEETEENVVINNKTKGSQYENVVINNEKKGSQYENVVINNEKKGSQYENVVINNEKKGSQYENVVVEHTTPLASSTPKVKKRPIPAPKPSKNKATEISAEDAEKVNKFRQQYEDFLKNKNNPNSDIDIKDRDLQEQVAAKKDKSAEISAEDAAKQGTVNDLRLQYENLLKDKDKPKSITEKDSAPENSDLGEKLAAKYEANKNAIDTIYSDFDNPLSVKTAQKELLELGYGNPEDVNSRGTFSTYEHPEDVDFNVVKYENLEDVDFNVVRDVSNAS